MKKVILCLSILFILLIEFNYSVSKIKADSGFDAGYSSSSSDSYSSSSSNSNYSGNNTFAYIVLLTSLISITFTFIVCTSFTNKKRLISTIIGIILGIIISLILNSDQTDILNISKKSFSNIELVILLSLILIACIKRQISLSIKIKNERIKLSTEEIKNIDSNLDINKFNELTFQIYKDIQIAWMNFNLDTIKNLVSDEIYNMYSMQLDTLKVKGQQNIMSDIKYIDSYISKVSIENNIETIESILKVTCYDYIVNKKNKVIRGNKYKKMTYIYRLTFTKNLSQNNNKCPNCGNEININSSSKCEYCNSTIINNETNWIMTKKQMLKQF